MRVKASDRGRAQGRGPPAQTHQEREALKRDFERIERYFDQEFSRDGAHGLALFCAGLDKLWIQLQLPDPVPDEIKVERDFYLAPLAPLVGRGDGALVAAVEPRARQPVPARGRAPRGGCRPERGAAAAHDQGGWSQSRFQRHVDELAAEHLRDVAEEVNRRIRRNRHVRLVVAGPEEQRSEFEELLSQEARQALAGWASAEAHAGPPELLAAAAPVLERARAARRPLTSTAGARSSGAAAGPWPAGRATLEAASDGRVELLLYEEGRQRPAWQCPKCGRASAEGGSCPLDGTELEQRREGLDLALHQTLAHGGRVCVVRGPAGPGAARRHRRAPSLLKS